MQPITARTTLCAALFTTAAAVCAHDAGRTLQPDQSQEQARAKLGRPVVLAPDDVRSFAAPPDGFADAPPGVARGRVEEFAYDSPVTGTTRKASVYLPAGFSAQRRYPVLYRLHGIGGT